MLFWDSVGDSAAARWADCFKCHCAGEPAISSLKRRTTFNEARGKLQQQLSNSHGPSRENDGPEL